MAKELNDIDEDIFVDDFESLFDDGPKSKGPVRDFATGIKRGFIETLLSPAGITKIVGSLLPGGYGRAVRFGADVFSETQALYDKAVEEFTPSLNEIRQGIKENASAVGKLPSSLSDKVNKWARSGDAQATQEREPTEDEKINSKLDELFKQTVSTNTALLRDNKTAASLKALDSRYSMRAGNATVKGLRQLVNFNYTNTAIYQRKNLELQYRKLYTLKEIAGTLRSSMFMAVSELRSITHNTSLPDTVKYDESDEKGAGTGLRQRLFGAPKKAVSELYRSFGDTIKENITRQISQQGANFSNAVQQALFGIEMGSMMGDVGGSASMQAGETIAPTLLEELGNKAGRSLRTRLGKMSKDSRLRRGSDVLNYTVESLPETLSDWARSQTQSFGIRGRATDFIKSLIPQAHGEQATVANDFYSEAYKPVPFDKRAHEALTVVLPEYQSRILHEMEKLNGKEGGDDTRKVYSYQRSAMSTLGKTRQDIAKAILPKRDAESFASYGDELIKAMGAEKLSDDAKQSILEAVTRQVGEGRRFDPIKLVEQGGLTGEGATEASRHLSSYYRTDEDNLDYAQLNVGLKASRNIRNQIPNLQERINQFANTGYREQLRQLGVLTKEGGGTADTVNQDYWLDRLFGRRGLDVGEGEQATYGGRTFMGARSSDDKGRMEVHTALDTDSLAKQLATAMKPVMDNMTLGDLSGLPDKVDTGNEWLNKIHDEIVDLRKEGIINKASIADMADQFASRLGSMFTAGRDVIIQGSQEAAGKAKSAVGNAGDRATKWVKGLARLYGRQITTMYKGAKGLGGFALRRGGDLLGGLRSQFTDVFAKGQLTPLLRAEDIEAGKYIDALTGKVIKSIKDITGPVLDQDGNQVVTQEEYDKGLYNNRFKRILGGAANLATKAISTQFRYMKTLYDFGKSTLTKVKDTAREYLGDIYVKGEQTPRLKYRLIKEGFYIDGKTQKVIKSIKDVNGPVIDKDGNEILSQEDYDKGLTSKYGDLLVKGKAVAGRVTEAAGSIYGMYLSGLSAIGRGVSSLLGGIGAGRASPKTDFILNAIYNLLDNRLPGERLGPLSFDNAEEGKPTLSKRLKSRFQFLRRDKEKADRKAKLSERIKTRKESVKARLAKLTARKKKAAGKKKRKGGGSTLLSMILAGASLIGGVIKEGIGSLGSLLSRLLLGKRVTGAIGDIAEGAAGAAGKPKKGGLIRRTLGLGWKAIKGVGKFAGKAALTLGGLSMAGLGGALSAAGGFLASAASAVGAVIASPVVLGAAAVAGLAYGGYKLYKWYEGDLKPLQKLRLAQYGLDYHDKDNAKALLGFEELVYRDVRTTSNGAPDIKTSDPTKYVSYFLGNEPDEDDVTNFNTWFARRFKPQFLTHVALLNQFSRRISPMNEDKELDDADKIAFAKKTMFSRSAQNSPYVVTASPFKGESSVTGYSFVEAALDDVVDEYEDVKRDPHKPAIVGVTEATRMARKRRSRYRKPDGSLPSAAGRLDRAERARSLRMGTRASYTSVKTSVNDYRTSSATAKAVAMGAVSNGAIASLRHSDTKKDLNVLDGIRMHTYGLTDLDASTVNAILQMESTLTQLARYSGEIASLDIRPIEAFDKYCNAFGISREDPHAREEWSFWYQSRFVPVFTTWLSVMKALKLSPEPRVTLTAVEPALLHKAAVAIVDTTTMVKAGIKTSVWKVTASMKPGVLVMSQDKSICDDLLNATQNNSVNAKATVKVQTPRQVKADRQSNVVTFKPNPNTAPRTLEDKGKATVTPLYKDVDYSQYNKATSAYGDYGEGFSLMNQDTKDTSNGRKRPMGAKGDPVNIKQKGKGGVLDDLPMPKGDGFNNMKALLAKTAEITGVDGSLLATMAGIESGFRINARPSRGSATGLFQFTTKTWNAMLSKYGDKYGIPPGTQPTDPRANALMAAEYIRENQYVLRNSIKRPVMDTDLYMAHFLGADGAVDMLNTDGNAPAVDVNRMAARYNPSIFYDHGRPRTVKELYDLMAGKVETHARKYGAEMDKRPLPDKDKAPVRKPTTTASVRLPHAMANKEDADRTGSERHSTWAANQMGGFNHAGDEAGRDELRRALRSGTRRPVTSEQHAADMMAHQRKATDNANAYAQTLNTLTENSVELLTNIDKSLVELVKIAQEHKDISQQQQEQASSGGGGNNALSSAKAAPKPVPEPRTPPRAPISMKRTRQYG